MTTAPRRYLRTKVQLLTRSMPAAAMKTIPTHATIVIKASIMSMGISRTSFLIRPGSSLVQAHHIIGRVPEHVPLSTVTVMVAETSKQCHGQMARGRLLGSPANALPAILHRRTPERTLATLPAGQPESRIHVQPAMLLRLILQGTSSVKRRMSMAERMSFIPVA